MTYLDAAYTILKAAGRPLQPLSRRTAASPLPSTPAGVSRPSRRADQLSEMWDDGRDRLAAEIA